MALSIPLPLLLIPLFKQPRFFQTTVSLCL
nr:MAG TPA: hypothetical protein [Microviridae sp.]